MEISTLYGTVTAPDWSDDLIVRSLARYGEWAEIEAELLAPLLKASDSLWDLGAFLGTFTMGVFRLLQVQEVVLLEPNPELHAHLERNIRSNVSCPSVVLSAGVGAYDGWLYPQVTEDKMNHGARKYKLSNIRQPGASLCYSLRTLRKRFGCYDVLKIDIEGMEKDALFGDIEYLQSHNPVVWCECNENLDSFELLEFLLSLGYQVTYVAFPAFRRSNAKNNPDLIYPMAYEAALLAAQPERMHKFTGKAEGEDIICRAVSTVNELRCALFDTPRWCRRDWIMLNRAELIARLGRAHSNEKFEKFLSSTPPGETAPTN